MNGRVSHFLKLSDILEMGETDELQEEELEVLKSIYEGDDQFSSLSNSKHQYKFGDDGESKSFILEVIWGADYPNSLPELSLGGFYNKHVLDSVKKSIVSAVTAEAEQMLGMSMTYTLFEWVKENLESLLDQQPDKIQVVCDEIEKLEVKDADTAEGGGKAKVKKEQLTKNQKKRMWDKGGLHESDRERGWDWVDIVRHLSQTGGGEE